MSKQLTEKEKMISGQPYDPYDLELEAGRKNARRLLRKLQAIEEAEESARKAIFRELFGSTGTTFFLENPFICDYGFNIHWGENAYANFGCIFLDAAPIYVGKNVMMAPAVKLFTATHPIDATERNSGIEFAYPIHIGDNVWLGGGTIVNPGVSIGKNTVIGSGSVVTKDIPANVVAAGNPCRIIRTIPHKE